MSEVVHLLKKDRRAIGEDGFEVTRPRVRAVVTMFLSSGRNAWHSTWVRTYRPGDFSRDGRQVKAKVEARKERGTVFYLKVLPAIQLEFGQRKFIMAQINTDQPFRHIKLEEARFGPMGYHLDKFLEVVTAPSPLWKPSQSRTSSIIVQEVEGDYLDLAAYIALAKGRDRGTNPPIGSYKRHILETDWWEWTDQAYQEPISLRWYNKTLEALTESHERLLDVPPKRFN